MSSENETDDDEDVDVFKSNRNKKLLGQGPQLPDFDELLVNSADVDEKTRTLWLEIYRNACHDRERASMFVTDLVTVLSRADDSAHAIHGQTAVKYLEKMAKANDQLLKLVDQIHAYKNGNSSFNADDILDSLNNEKGKKGK